MSSMLRVAVQLLVVIIPAIEAENPKGTSAVGKVIKMISSRIRITGNSLATLDFGLEFEDLI